MNGGADQPAATVRTTVVQASSVFYDTPATLDKAEKLIAEAAGHGSQLMVFPEAFVGGYPDGSTFGLVVDNRTAKGKEDFRKYHAAAIDVPGPEVSRLASLAGRYKVFLVMGVVERADYTLYNTVPLADAVRGHGCTSVHPIILRKKLQLGHLLAQEENSRMEPANMERCLLCSSVTAPSALVPDCRICPQAGRSHAQTQMQTQTQRQQ